MTDHFARPQRPASSLSPNVIALHAKCDEDYAKGQAERAAARPMGSYTPFATAAAIPPPPAPGDLNIAIHVAQRMLATYGDSSGFSDILAFAQAHGGLTEALRILLRALGAEPGQTTGEAVNGQ